MTEINRRGKTHENIDDCKNVAELVGALAGVLVPLCLLGALEGAPDAEDAADEGNATSTER
jgi:hypothetical protein